MKKIILSLILIFAIIVSNAQNHQANTDKQSLDVGKLNIIHEHLLNDIKAGKVSGAVVLVAQNGKILHYEATGSADIERGKAITKDHIFRLASMSKPITGAAILMLIDQGKISLNDPLSKYIHQFKNMSVAIANTDPKAKYTTVPAYREVTIKDLLTHSSGLGQGKISSAEIAKITHSAYVTLSEYIPKIASMPLEFQPGSLTGYSPKVGFEILGRVVEIVSGETFDKFLSNHLFVPLEMKNTGFTYSPKSIRQRIPVMYKTTDKGLIRETSEQSLILDSIYFSGAGGIVGTT